MTNRTLMSLHGLRASHPQHENSEGFVAGDNLVTAILAAFLYVCPESRERPWQVTGSLSKSWFVYLENGKGNSSWPPP